MRKVFVTLITILAMMMSCTKEGDKTAFSLQESQIEEYVKRAVEGKETYISTTNKGSVKLILTEGEGEELKEDGVVSFYYAGFVFIGSQLSQSNLFTTNDKALAESLGLETDNPDQYNILTVSLSESNLVEGLKNGLVGAKAGEECIILFSGKYGFGSKQLGMIPANSALAYQVKIESISNN